MSAVQRPPHPVSRMRRSGQWNTDRSRSCACTATPFLSPEQVRRRVWRRLAGVPPLPLLLFPLPHPSWLAGCPRRCLTFAAMALCDPASVLLPHQCRRRRPRGRPPRRRRRRTPPRFPHCPRRRFCRRRSQTRRTARRCRRRCDARRKRQRSRALTICLSPSTPFPPHC